MQASLSLPPSAIWGNRTGWLIAVIVAAVMGGVLAIAYVAGGRTGRTELSRAPENLAPLTLPEEVAAFEPIVGFVPGDGGARLRGVVARVVERPGLVEDWLARGGRADVTKIEPLLSDVKSAFNQAEVTLFTDTADVTAYPMNTTRRELRAVKDLGKALLHAGFLREAAGDLDGAKSDYEAAFTLGRALFDQRLVLEQVTYGVRLMREAAEGLAAVAEAGGSDAGTPRAVADALQTWQVDRLEPMRAVFLVEDAQISGKHVGDYMALIEDSSEPVWRVESVLALGRHRFNAARKADQLAAEAEVARLADESSDPVIRRVAVQARDLELAEHRMVRFGRF